MKGSEFIIMYHKLKHDKWNPLPFPYDQFQVKTISKVDKMILLLEKFDCNIVHCILNNL